MTLRKLASTDMSVAAETFCMDAPHRAPPYSKRNWGGLLHSLCSYQGKLKPAIAHFLVSAFTQPGDRVVDPMSGIGTIPLEARRQGRFAIANDLSPLAATVSRAKLEPFNEQRLWKRFANLSAALNKAESPSLPEAEFGLNGPVGNYFHQQTLAEIFAARQWFMGARTDDGWAAADAVLLTGLLHILHGNRPYALSRNSHPITPFAPSGAFEYKSVVEHLETRLLNTVPALLMLRETSIDGFALQRDFRDLASVVGGPVDAVITSPPFSSSLRFWSSNWMRLWLAGWSPADFVSEPKRYLETEQRRSYKPYGEFAASASSMLRPGGALILHLGETARGRMVDGVTPQLTEYFKIEHVGSESVADTESHGLRDKGATTQHWYVFATRR